MGLNDRPGNIGYLLREMCNKTRIPLIFRVYGVYGMGNSTKKRFHDDDLIMYDRGGVILSYQRRNFLG